MIIIFEETIILFNVNFVFFLLYSVMFCNILYFRLNEMSASVPYFGLHSFTSYTGFAGEFIILFTT